MEKFADLKFESFKVPFYKRGVGGILVLLLFTFVGCASITIPEYIQDKKPYKHKFYASFDDTLNASLQVLEESGWQVAKKSDPAVFERSESGVDSNKQILLFSKVRQTALFFGTRYARLNIYLRTSAQKDVTEVEIRYITINSTPLKAFKNYKHDHAVSRLFNKIESKLSQ